MVVEQQQSNPSETENFSWEQMMEDAEDLPANQNLSAATNVSSDPDGVRLVTVSAPTEFLKGVFKTLTNTEKKQQLKNQFTAPDLPLTLTPRLDMVWEAECYKGVKSLNQQLSEGQAFFLDTTGHLVEIIDTINTGKQLSIDDVEEHVKTALSLLGNAPSQLSTLRRVKVVEEYDKDLISFCQNFKDYQAEIPDLYGVEF